MLTVQGLGFGAWGLGYGSLSVSGCSTKVVIVEVVIVELGPN